MRLGMGFIVANIVAFAVCGEKKVEISQEEAEVMDDPESLKYAQFVSGRVQGMDEKFILPTYIGERPEDEQQN